MRVKYIKIFYAILQLNELKEQTFRYRLKDTQFCIYDYECLSIDTETNVVARWFVDWNGLIGPFT